MWAPEGIWFYNVEGRSATDGHDQSRQKIQISARRIVRFGSKKTFCFIDLAFTNGAIIEELLHADRPKKERNALSRVNFSLEWAQDGRRSSTAASRFASGRQPVSV